MPKAVFPQKQKNWVVSNTKTYFGDIGETYNIDLDYVLGAIVQGNQFLPYTTNQDIPGMNMATDFAYSNPSGSYYYWAVCEKVYRAYGTNQPFAVDTTTNSPTNLNNADIEVVGKTTGNYSGRDILVVSGVNGGVDLAIFNADLSSTSWKPNWWTGTDLGGLAQPALKANTPHVLLTFGNTPILFISDGNMVHRINTPHSTTSSDVMYGAIILPEKYTINWMQKTREKIYIGAMLSYDDRIASSVFEYDPYAEQIRQVNVDEGATIGFVWNNILYIIDKKGQLRYWNGGTFTLVNSLPIAFYEGIDLSLPHRNGIVVSEKNVYFFLPGYPPRINGGIWVFSSDTNNFYHLASPQPSRVTQKGFGETFIQGGANGALYSPFYGTLLAGINFVYSFDSPVNGIFSYGWNQNGLSFSPAKRSYFITSKIFSSDINSVWRNIAIKYNPRIFPSGRIQNAKIIVKYQTSDMINYNENGLVTWVNSTTFTVPYYVVGDSINVGDEVFFTKGDNSGLMAHVVSITGTDPKTIVLDKGFLSNPSGISYFVWGNWKKIPDTITDNTQQSKVIDVGEISEWIRFKIEIESNGDTYPGFGIEEIQVGYQPNLMVEK